MRQQEDWYAYLNVPADAPSEQIEPAVERLSRQAAALAVTAPERSQRLRDTVRAIKRDLLSGPEARARYDQGRESAAAAPPAPEPQAPPSAVPPSTGFPLPSAYALPSDPPVSGFPPPSAYAPPSPPSASAPTAVPPPPPYPPSASPPPAAAPPVGGPGGGAAGGPYGGGPYGGGPGGGERISARLVRFLRTGWVCAECGKEAVPSDKFCTRCGTPIIPTRHEQAPPTPRVACANCAAPLGANDAFCARCGTRASK